MCKGPVAGAQGARRAGEAAAPGPLGTLWARNHALPSSYYRSSEASQKRQSFNWPVKGACGEKKLRRGQKPGGVEH